LSGRAAKFTQAEIGRIFKAAAEAGLDVRVEIREDGIIATTVSKAAKSDTNGASMIDTPEDLMKLL
jgi:hypothetical protein